jgi:hypothetical protein
MTLTEIEHGGAGDDVRWDDTVGDAEGNQQRAEQAASVYSRAVSDGVEHPH